MKIDLNCDCGESFGNYKLGLDEKAVKYVSSVNIACGFHAGDPLVMNKTVQLAKENAVAVGAHPGFPDLVGFGRRNMNVSLPELKAMIQYQLGALSAFCKLNKIPLQHVKPHGAMYNMTCRDEKMAFAIAESIAEFDENLILLGMSGSKMLEATKIVGLKSKNEVFADRAYNDDGTLVSRSLSGAVIKDENLAIERVIQMVKTHTVTSINGKIIEVSPDSICVHGDNEKAVDFLLKIKTELESEGIKISAMGKN